MRYWATSTIPTACWRAQFRYWRGELAGLPEVLELPTDRPRPPVQSYRGAVIEFGIEAGLRARVDELARARGATVSMVLQSAMAVLLHRLGAGEDIPIGGPVAGRTDDALSDLVGFFVNTWVLRVDMSGNPSFGQLLGQVRAKALAAYENQDAPFERLVELLNPTRSTAYHPLFQVSLALQNNPLPRLEFPGLTVTPVTTTTRTARFDLFFTLTEQPSTPGAPGAITGLVEYATDLFDETTVRTIVKRYVRVLAAVCADPAVVVGDVGILDPAERRRLAPVRGPAGGAVGRALGEIFDGCGGRGCRTRWRWVCRDRDVVRGAGRAVESVGAGVDRVGVWVRRRGGGGVVAVGGVGGGGVGGVEDGGGVSAGGSGVSA